METLRKASNAIGSRMVEVKGEREIGVGEAVGLWASLLVFALVRINETGPDYSIGMYRTRPVVYGKEQQVPQEE